MRELTKLESEEFDSIIVDYFFSVLDQTRIKEMFLAEKELQKAMVMLQLWEILRNGISDQYPQLLKWCPQNTITIHDPELPGLVIVDSVNV